MKMRIFCSMSAIFLGLLFTCQASWAAKMYVNHPQDVALRSGPAADNKVFRMLKPGTAVDVLSNKDEWSRVKASIGNGNVKIGWIQSEFLGNETPEQMRMSGMERENVSLKEKLAGLEKEKSELLQRQKELTDHLAKLQASYEELKSGSANYIKLKEEYDSNASTLTQVKSHNQSLLQENGSLRLTRNVIWFGMGALVLLVGWFIGVITGRMQRKRRVSYHI